MNNDKDCLACIKNKTEYCPNSEKCFSINGKPFYQTKYMILEENQQLKTEKEQLNSLVNSCQEEIRRLKKELNALKVSEEEWLEKSDK